MRLGEFKAELERVIEDGADRVPELFEASSDFEKLSRQVRSSSYGRIDIERVGYRGPIELLTQPLHDLLVKYGYHPDHIKAQSPRANYSSGGFTDSDFPLPSVEVKKTYTTAVVAYGEAKVALEEATHASSSSRAGDLWDE